MTLVMWSWAKGSSGLPFGVLFLLCGAGLALAGCADMMTDDALQQDVAQLRQDVNTLMLTARRGRGEAEAVSENERRAREQASDSARQTAALSTRTENLNTELSRLSARLDDVSQRVERLGRQIQAAGAAAPKAAPPASPSAPPVSSAPSAPPVPAPSPAPAPAVSRAPTGGQPPAETSRGSATGPTGGNASGAMPEESYQAAYLDFSKGRYALAIPAFREFVRRFPDSPLADSAQHAIGESYFSLARASAASAQADKSRQDLEQAVQEFRKVIVNYPRGSKVPTALYKEALALTELKQTALAQARLQYLIDHFPQSEEAPLAKERLAALKQ